MAGTPQKRKRKAVEAARRRLLRREQEKAEFANDDEDRVEQESAVRQLRIRDREFELPVLWREEVDVDNDCKFPEEIPTDELVEAARRSHGIMAVFCRILGISRHIAKKMIEEFEDVKDAFGEEKENILDLAECRLYEAIARGEAWAISMMLQTQGRKRGYKSEDSTTEDQGEILKALERMTDGEEEEC